MQVTVLGAGGYAGKSCILLRLLEERKSIVLDCGLHVKELAEKRFPDFSSLTSRVDAVLVSHYHLDHVGGLPFMTEKAALLTESAAMYMTRPTAVLAEMMCADHIRVRRNSSRDDHVASGADVENCFSRAKTLPLDTPTEILPGVFVTAYLAGHALGGSMFFVQSKTASVFYTGDFRVTPERHLPPAVWPSLATRPDLVISECVHGGKEKDSRRIVERRFIDQVLSAVEEGKVQIPLASFGKVQEIAVLLDQVWNSFGITVPIYIWSLSAIKVGNEFAKHISWCNEDIQDSEPFSYRHIKQFDQAQMLHLLHKNAKPLILITCPSSLVGGGSSSSAFEQLRYDKRNLVFTNSDRGFYQPSQGTKFGDDRPVDLPYDDVQCQFARLPFSNHTDGAGIEAMLSHLAPREILLVHGVAKNAAPIVKFAETNLNTPCTVAQDGLTVSVPRAKEDGEGSKESSGKIFSMEDANLTSSLLEAYQNFLSRHGKRKRLSP